MRLLQEPLFVLVRPSPLSLPPMLLFPETRQVQAVQPRLVLGFVPLVARPATQSAAALFAPFAAKRRNESICSLAICGISRQSMSALTAPWPPATGHRTPGFMRLEMGGAGGRPPCRAAVLACCRLGQRDGGQGQRLRPSPWKRLRPHPVHHTCPAFVHATVNSNVCCGEVMWPATARRSWKGS